MPDVTATMELCAQAEVLVLRVTSSDPAVPVAVLHLAWEEVPSFVDALEEQWEAHQQRQRLRADMRAGRA